MHRSTVYGAYVNQSYTFTIATTTAHIVKNYTLTAVKFYSPQGLRSKAILNIIPFTIIYLQKFSWINKNVKLLEYSTSYL